MNNFAMNNKEHILLLRDNLIKVGILPHLPSAATHIKESLEGKPLEEIPTTIMAFLVANPGILDPFRPFEGEVPAPPEFPKAAPPVRGKGEPVVSVTSSGPLIRRGKQPKGWIIAIYGQPGVGKSTLAAMAPKPIFADVEDGLARLDVVSSPCASWQAVVDFSTWFGGQDDFLTMVVDTADVLEKRLWAHLCKIYKWKSIGSPDYGKGYQEAFDAWVSYLDGLRLMAAKGKNVVLTAHSNVKTFLNPEGESYDRHNMNLHNKVAEYFFGQMDGVFFCHFDSSVRKNAGGDYVASTSGQRLISCSDTLSAQVKNRFNIQGKVEMNQDFFKLLA
jgi:hypothetical protein